MRILEDLIQRGMISDDERELMRFGLIQVIHYTINIGIMICIGFFFHLTVWQSLLFYFSYSSVRIFAGGYHSSTRIGCYLSSVICISVSFGIFEYVDLDRVICLLIYLMSLIVIIRLAPMDNSNKRLYEAEKDCFRKRLWVVLFAETGLFLIALVLNMCDIWRLLTLSMTFVGMMLVMALIQGYIRKTK